MQGLTLPSRLTGSPYPTGPIPDSLFLVNDQAFTESQRLTVETLQGVASQGGAALYRSRAGGYAIWAADLEKRPGLTIVRDFQNDFPGLLKKFRSQIKGYVLCDLHTNSANAAISLCGVIGAVAATTDQSAVLDGLGLPMLADARGKDESWALASHPTLYSKRILSYQKPGLDLLLADYSVFAHALHFYAPVPGDLSSSVLARMEPNSMVFGWGEDEFNLVQSASAGGVGVHAADYCLNLSALTRFQVPLAQKQPAAPVLGTLPVTGGSAAPAKVHTVCFLMSDGDNLQWTLGDFAASKLWYGSPNRGKTSIGWTLPPALSELAPTALDALYRMAGNVSGARDYFVAAPSGTGYMYPEALPPAELDGAAALTGAFMAKADMHILNIIGNDRNPKYFAPYLRLKAIDAIIYYPYINYAGLAGDIFFVEGKPVIGGFSELRVGANSPAGLAAKINARPKDPLSKDGYSLVPVHVWTNGVDSVNACVAALGKDVRVVAPDEFVRLVTANLAGILPNAVRPGPGREGSRWHGKGGVVGPGGLSGSIKRFRRTRESGESDVTDARGRVFIGGADPR